ncbi:hypothetical protein IAI10_14390 [Clostridium sp. 19966]|uniref:hypothetical protein n=1 Tax=Clostridium sp. 19966 TaxID=2768166 RepID=UPI0028E04842|nr:hypothetical protein [Clostridium sp. 19966]MDT8717854.1 hypothetical protein [Clostridium sp. 19966]
MEDVKCKKTDMENLNKRIDEAREILNGVCDADYDGSLYTKRLYISKCLDILIVEYMRLKKHCNTCKRLQNN